MQRPLIHIDLVGQSRNCKIFQRFPLIARLFKNRFDFPVSASGGGNRSSILFKSQPLNIKPAVVGKRAESLARINRLPLVNPQLRDHQRSDIVQEFWLLRLSLFRSLRLIDRLKGDCPDHLPHKLQLVVRMLVGTRSKHLQLSK